MTSASWRLARISAEIEGERAAHGSFGEAGGQCAVLRLELGTALGEQRFEVRGGMRAQAVNDGAGADGGQQFLGVLGEQDEGGVLGRLFEDLEQASWLPLS